MTKYTITRAYKPKAFSLPENFPLRKQCYITVSTILQASAMNSDWTSDNTFVSISGMYFRNVGVRYLTKVLKLLDGIVERDSYYIPNEKPYGYRLKLKGDIEGIDMVSSHNVEMDYLFQFQKDLTIDSPMAHNWNEYYNQNRVSCVKEQNQYNAYYMMIDLIEHKCWESKYDPREHRRHTLLSRTKSKLLQFVRLKGKRLISIDYKCFQPLISTILFQPWFYDKRSKFNLWSFNSKMDLHDKKSHQQLLDLRLNINDIYSKYIDGNGIDILTYDVQVNKTLAFNIVEDVFRYCNFCYSGTIYEHFVSIATKKHTRQSIKKPTMRWLYQKGKPRCTDTADMRREFMTVTDVFDLYKAMGLHSYLPVLLTIIETTIMFDYVIPRIEKEHYLEPIDTKHDNVLAIKNEKSISKIMIEEAEKVLRVRPKVKIEYL